MTDKMLIDKDGAVGRITFNNPARRNAVSLEMWEAATAMLEDLAADDSIRIAVITGAGDKAFISGADISKFEDERASHEAIAHYNATTARFHETLHGFLKPAIAMVRGYCVGGGVAVAIGCDLRICSDTSRFAVPAAKLGLGYGYGGIERLVQLVGPAFAKEIFFTARRFEADEALAMGLINRVVADAELEKYVRDYTDMIAANAPMTVASVKQIVGEIGKDEGLRDMAACERSVAECFASEDYIEGRRAFMEKRIPQFKGR